MLDRHRAGAERRLRTRRGLAAVYVALILVVLIGFVALGIDVGRICLVRTELQGAADAAARAAVWRIPDVDLAAAAECARLAAEANTAAGDPVVIDPLADVQFGIWHPAETDPGRRWEYPIDNQARANAVRIRVRRVKESANPKIKPVPLLFAPVVGWQEASIAVEAIALIDGTDATAGHGLGFVGLDRVSLEGRVTVDSYNPAKGAGAEGTILEIRDNVAIASNGTITLTPGMADGDTDATILIGGDVHPGPKAQDAIQTPAGSDRVRITGWQSSLLAPMEYAAPGLPPFDHTAEIPAAWFDSNGRFTPPAGASLPPSDSAASLEAGPRVYVLDSLSLKDTQTLTITSPIRLYIRGNLTLEGEGAMLRNDGPPANLEIILLGGSQDVQAAPTLFAVRGSSLPLRAHVYAPLSHVEIDDCFSFRGAIVGRTLTVKGNTHLHYDESDAYAPAGGGRFRVQLVR